MNNKLSIISSKSRVEEEVTVEKELLQWNRPFCSFAGEPVVPKIYTGEGNVPPGYNGVLVELDGKTKSTLNWSKQIQQAEKFIQEGHRILWYLNLGLFEEVPFSLFNNSQALTLSIAVDHFNELWERYSTDSFGVCLYRGSLDFSEAFTFDDKVLLSLKKWLEERGMSEVEASPSIDKELLSLYACDVGMDYLDILAQSLSVDIECFALLDAGKIDNALLEARLLSTERSDRLRFVVKGGKLPSQDISWDKTNAPFGILGEGSVESPREEKASLALCLPEISMSSISYKGLEEVLMFLIDNNVFFRVVPEANITVEWDGLDYLIVSPKALSPYGIRKLQGFCAAGGTVISLGEPLGLMQEKSFAEWKETSII
ncbi:MAG: hypothetical protein VX777_10225 [Chlamydiota bacterium]|nr:hypothetical protein [Chlamydiota bacterium]